MQAQVANQIKTASEITLSPSSRWESAPASHRAHPNEAILQSKQLTPLCIATKASRKSSKRRKPGSTSRQNCPLTSFLLGVDPSKPPRKPSQSSAPRPPETPRTLVPCQSCQTCHAPSSDPTIKNMRAEQTGDQKRLTMMCGIHSRWRSKWCMRPKSFRQDIVRFRRYDPPPAIKPYSPPQDPLTTPRTPSESQERNAAGAAGAPHLYMFQRVKNISLIRMFGKALSAKDEKVF